MKKERMIKAACDGVIFLLSAVGAVISWRLQAGSRYLPWCLIIFFLCGAASVADLVRQCRSVDRTKTPADKEDKSPLQIQALLLLDEQNKPVRSWTMAGCTSLVIGRRNKEEQVDVDLEDCEYSTFVDFQHAALNFCLDRWYLEDLGSANGVRVQKAEDGCCYEVTNRPCRVEAGDIIHIANTRLLLS